LDNNKPFDGEICKRFLSFGLTPDPNNWLVNQKPKNDGRV